MGYSRFILFLFSSVFLINHCSASASDFRSSCASNGNFTANSTYEANLNRLFSNLSSDQDFNYGFYNMSMGQSSDRINVIGLCRGDKKEDVCKSCVYETISELQQSCPNYKEAIGWSEFCTLRYSNREIFGVMETDPFDKLYAGDALNVDAFNQALSFLFNNLSSRAAAGGPLLKYAAGSTEGPSSQRIYAVVQCTPDLSQQECSDCLAIDIKRMKTQCYGKTGCRIPQPSCNLRYEVNDSFFEAGDVITQPSSPPPTPTEGFAGNRKNTTPTIIMSMVGSIVGVLLIFLCIWIILRCRKSKETLETVDEMTEAKSLQYDFATVRAATNNFNDENKLGQGGFGAVYKGRLPNEQDVAVKRLSSILDKEK